MPIGLSTGRQPSIPFLSPLSLAESSASTTAAGLTLTLCLPIDDNGIGIKPEYQRRLFGMFERVHQDKSYDGTGIGLAIVRKAVERMGGTTGVQSDGLTGSSFWIELPASPD